MLTQPVNLPKHPVSSKGVARSEQSDHQFSPGAKSAKWRSNFGSFKSMNQQSKEQYSTVPKTNNYMKSIFLFIVKKMLNQ